MLWKKDFGQDIPILSKPIKCLAHAQGRSFGTFQSSRQPFHKFKLVIAPGKRLAASPELGAYEWYCFSSSPSNEFKLSISLSICALISAALSFSAAAAFSRYSKICRSPARESSLRQITAFKTSACLFFSSVMCRSIISRSSSAFSIFAASSPSFAFQILCFSIALSTFSGAAARSLRSDWDKSASVSPRSCFSRSITSEILLDASSVFSISFSFSGPATILDCICARQLWRECRTRIVPNHSAFRKRNRFGTLRGRPLERSESVSRRHGSVRERQTL